MNMERINKMEGGENKMDRIINALGYELGKTYYCGYWGRKHTIEDIKQGGVFDYEIKSRWEDGHYTWHATCFDKKRDYIVNA